MKYYEPFALRAAIDRLSSEGVSIRALCVAIGSGTLKYYDALNSKMRRKTLVGADFLAPLIEKVPKLAEYLDTPPSPEPLPPIEDDPDFQKLVAIEAELRKQIEFLQSQLEKKDDQLSKLIDTVINRQ